MRAVLLILILAVVALIVLMATGLVNINQTRPAKVPAVAATGNGVAIKRGQAPAFDVETGTVSVGAQPKTVTVPAPALKVTPANEQAPAQAATNNAQ
jgi:hypothetical protein